jgi:GNAT superfamily N-acetyltransferase
MRSPIAILDRIRSKWRHGLLLQFTLDRLALHGLEFKMSYLVLEGCGGPDPEPHANAEQYELAFLGPDDVDRIATLPGEGAAEDYKKRFEAGQLCYAVLYGDDLAAVTWADLNLCNAPHRPFELTADEAYLHSAYTAEAYRGRGLAVWLRQALHRELAARGRHTYYSVSEASNAPALRLKKKLRSRPLERRLHIRLFKRFTFRLRLKLYEPWRLA